MVLIKLDENMPDSAAETLRSAGHDVDRARDEGLAGVDDHAVLAAASAAGRVLVTLDLDFADVVRHPPAGTAGIVVLRPHDQSIGLVRQVVLMLARLLGQEEAHGRLWIVDESRLRIWPGAV